MTHMYLGLPLFSAVDPFSYNVYLVGQKEFWSANVHPALQFFKTMYLITFLVQENLKKDNSLISYFCDCKSSDCTAA